MKSYVVVIPVREFLDTKKRLGPTLSARDRARLSVLFLRSVLAEIEKSRAISAVIVASDPSLVKKQIRGFPKLRILGETRHHGGVNYAMDDGLKYLEKNHPRASVLLIPSDLPLLTSQALDGAAMLLGKYDLLINPSVKLDGTSLIAFNTIRGRIPLHYDDNSFPKHRKEARNAELRYRVLRKKEFSFDVDSLEDLEELKRIYGVSKMKQLFSKLESRAE